MKNIIYSLLLLIIFTGCSAPSENKTKTEGNNAYCNYKGRDDILTGGVKMVTVKTPKGDFKVWTKRIGNNPDIKVLLLHGGPGATHEYFECFDSFFPGAGIEYYYYDQLESAYSDQPGDSSLWTVDRYVDEVEQVRKAIVADSSNFYLLGHSWGGILAMEYALKYQKNLKGLIISNMMASVPAYIKYADEVLGPQMDPKILKEIKELESKGEFTSEKYLNLVTEYYYPEHVLRMPPDEWPEPVVRSFSKSNYDIYLAMQGPSEFGVVGDAKLKNWDVSKRLSEITVPTLVIGATHDTMDPKYMKWMSEQVQNGEFLLCPNGSHMAMYDDQQTYFDGLIRFIKKVDAK